MKSSQLKSSVSFFTINNNKLAITGLPSLTPIYSGTKHHDSPKSLIVLNPFLYFKLLFLICLYATLQAFLKLSIYIPPLL